MRVLVAEDSPTGGEAILATLRDAGHEADLAVDGYAAIALTHARKYDAAILDMYMPGIDGITLLRELRRIPAWVGVPVVVLTATSAEDLIDIRNELKDLGPVTLLRKPQSFAVVLKALEKVATAGS